MFKGCSDKLDRVINRFTKLCRHIAALPSSQRLAVLNLPTLEHRRTRGDCIKIFRLFNNDLCLFNYLDFLPLVLPEIMVEKFISRGIIGMLNFPVDPFRLGIIFLPLLLRLQTLFLLKYYMTIL